MREQELSGPAARAQSCALRAWAGDAGQGGDDTAGCPALPCVCFIEERNEQDAIEHARRRSDALVADQGALRALRRRRRY